jgi:hypothetical protein
MLVIPVQGVLPSVYRFKNKDQNKAVEPLIIIISGLCLNCYTTDAILREIYLLKAKR